MTPIIEIYSPSPPEDNLSALVNISQRARKPVQESLGIPDPDDWEHRITFNFKPQSDTPVSVAFTYLGEDYPDQMPGQIFHPSDEQILEAGRTVQELVRPLLGDVPVEMLAWANTFFALGNPEQNELPPPPPPEVTTQIAGLDLQPRLEVALSPALLASSSPEDCQAAVHQIAVLVADTLGVPSEQINTNTSQPEAAQTDFSVNLYFPGLSGDKFPPQLGEFFVQAIQCHINQHPATKDLDPNAVTVWILPGQPDRFIVPAAAPAV